MNDAATTSAADSAAAQAMAALALNAVAAGAQSADAPTSPSAAPPTRCILTEQSVTLLSLICRCLDAGSLLSAYHSCRALSAAASHPLTFQHDIRLCVKRLSAVQLSGPKATFHSPRTFARAIHSKLLRHFRILKLHAREASGSLLLSLLEPLLLPSCPPLHALTIDAALVTEWEGRRWCESFTRRGDFTGAHPFDAASAQQGSWHLEDEESLAKAKAAKISTPVYAPQVSATAAPRVLLRAGGRMSKAALEESRRQTAKTAAASTLLESELILLHQARHRFRSAESFAFDEAPTPPEQWPPCADSPLVVRLMSLCVNPALSYLRVLALTCSYSFAHRSPLLRHLPRSLELLQLTIVDPGRSHAEGSQARYPFLHLLPLALPSALAALPRFVQLVVQGAGTSGLASVAQLGPDIDNHGTRLADLRTLARIVESCPGLEAISWLVPVDLQLLATEVATLAAAGGDTSLPSVRKLFDVVCTWLPPVAISAPAAASLDPAAADEAQQPPRASAVVDDPLSPLSSLFPDLRSVSFASYRAPSVKDARREVRDDDSLPLWPAGMAAQLQELQATMHRDTHGPQPSMRRMLRHIASGGFSALHSLVLMGLKSEWAAGQCFELPMLLSSLPRLTLLTLTQIRLVNLLDFRRAPKLLTLRGLTWPHHINEAHAAAIASNESDLAQLYPGFDLSACFPALTTLEVSNVLNKSPRVGNGATLRMLLSIPHCRSIKWGASCPSFLHPSALDSTFAALEASWAADAAARQQKEDTARAVRQLTESRSQFLWDMRTHFGTNVDEALPYWNRLLLRLRAENLTYSEYSVVKDGAGNMGSSGAAAVHQLTNEVIAELIERQRVRQRQKEEDMRIGLAKEAAAAAAAATALPDTASLDPALRPKALPSPSPSAAEPLGTAALVKARDEAELAALIASREKEKQAAKAAVAGSLQAEIEQRRAGAFAATAAGTGAEAAPFVFDVAAMDASARGKSDLLGSGFARSPNKQPKQPASGGFGVLSAAAAAATAAAPVSFAFSSPLSFGSHSDAATSAFAAHPSSAAASAPSDPFGFAAHAASGFGSPAKAHSASPQSSFASAVTAATAADSSPSSSDHVSTAAAAAVSLFSFAVPSSFGSPAGSFAASANLFGAANPFTPIHPSSAVFAAQHTFSDPTAAAAAAAPAAPFSFAPDAAADPVAAIALSAAHFGNPVPAASAAVAPATAAAFGVAPGLGVDFSFAAAPAATSPEGGKRGRDQH